MSVFSLLFIVISFFIPWYICTRFCIHKFVILFLKGGLKLYKLLGHTTWIWPSLWLSTQWPKRTLINTPQFVAFLVCESWSTVKLRNLNIIVSTPHPRLLHPRVLYPWVLHPLIRKADWAILYKEREHPWIVVSAGVGVLVPIPSGHWRGNCICRDEIFKKFHSALILLQFLLASQVLVCIAEGETGGS